MTQRKIYFRPSNNMVYDNILPPTNAASVVPDWFKKMERFVHKSNKPMTPDGQNNMTMKKTNTNHKTIQSFFVTKPKPL